MKFLWLEAQLKMDNLDVWPLSVENEALLTCNSNHSSFNLFKNVCERSWR